MWRIGSSLLTDIAWNIAFVGLVLIIGASIAGPSRVARSIRWMIAPAFVGGPGARSGIGAAVVLILVIWAPLPALTNWFGILVSAAIVAACVEGLRGLCLADRAEAVGAEIDVAVVEIDVAVDESGIAGS